MSNLDAPKADIIEIEIIHYCGKCGWASEPARYVDMEALIYWGKDYDKEHKKVCTGDVVTRCVW